MVAADPKWCPTTATDARSFYYNPEYIQALDPGQTEFVLAHEALHCALSHFARRQHRVRVRWDVACDYAINPLLVKDGLKPPPNTLLEDSFDGMTAEEIYPYIDEHNADEPMDRHVYEGKEQSAGGRGLGQDRDRGAAAEFDNSGPGDLDDGADAAQGQERETDGTADRAAQPPPLSESERESLSIQWQQRMAAAAQQAMQAGKLSGEMARMVDHLLQPRLPWRMLLARYMTAIGRDDFSYMRPARREGSAILPSLRSAHIEVVVALDTSGSITDEELEEFLAEVEAIKGQLRARITLLACDADLAADGPWVFEEWEECRLPREFSGGGGTCFEPVFQWVECQDKAPDLLVYFTDADGKFPDNEPAYPVLWLIKGKSPVPWGQRVQLN